MNLKTFLMSIISVLTSFPPIFTATILAVLGFLCVIAIKRIFF